MLAIWNLGSALNSNAKVFLDSFSTATESGPTNSLRDMTGCLCPWFLMPKWKTGLVDPAPTDFWMSMYFHKLVVLILFVKNSKNACKYLLSQSAVFIWTHIWMPLQQQHLSSSCHPSRIQPEERQRVVFFLAWASVLFAPYSLKIIPPPLPNPLSYLLLLWCWKSSPLIEAAIIVMAEPPVLEVGVQPLRIEGYSLQYVVPVHWHLN